MQTLREIDQEIARLKERAASIIASEKAGVIERIKEAIAYYGLTGTDLGLGGAATPGKQVQAAKAGKTTKRSKGAKPAVTAASPADSAAEMPAAKKPRAGAGQVKYRDDAGNAWTGFGPKPRWLVEALGAGKALDDLKA